MEERETKNGGNERRLDISSALSRLGLRFSLNKPARPSPTRPLTSLEAMLPLECLRPGEWAEVCDVCGEPGWVGRLAELGVRAGTLVQMLRGGSPCLIQVGGGRLSLRGDQAMQVLVRPVSAS
jgi:ferrous iron transport protein A